MKILVTGANGFIGTYACALLAKNSHSVIPLVRNERQVTQLASSYSNLVVANLGASSSLKGAAEAQPQMVVHFAAELPKNFTGEEAEKAAAANAKMDRQVIGFCQDNGLGLVYASSASVYGFGVGGVKKESDAVEPTGRYAFEKFKSEQMGLDSLTSRGLQFAALRINAPYGPNQRTRTVLNIFIDLALKGLSLQYHGSGNRQQDFTYVEDVAEAVLLAIETRASGIFNIAAGEPATMKELAELVVEAVPGCSSKVTPSGEEDPQEGVTALFSIKKARKQLGWTPRISLREGLQRTIEARLA
jgi:nucleoside-diphosphate-sugar epimerase